MTCATDEVLRAKLDGELSDAELATVERHLASCVDCRRRAEGIARQRERMGVVLASLEPLPGESPTEPRIAFAHLQARKIAEAETPSLLGRVFSRRLRPIWGVLALASLLAACLSFAPARSWAQKILAMLRVQKISVVALDPNVLSGRGDARMEKVIGQFLSDNLVVTLTPGEPQLVVDAEQASQTAGFKVRLLRDRADQPQIRVQGEGAFHMTLNRDRLQAILDDVGRSDLQLPASLDGATIAVHIPKLALVQYGNCSHGGHARSGNSRETQPEVSSCVVLVQVPSPTVSVPPDVNLAQIAEAALQLGGMKADEAHSFCQTVDWTSTLVIPIPRDASSYQTEQVDGVQGTLITLPGWGRYQHPGYTLVWVKNGIIYSLTGVGNSGDAVPMAESLD